MSRMDKEKNHKRQLIVDLDTRRKQSRQQPTIDFDTQGGASTEESRLLRTSSTDAV